MANYRVYCYDGAGKLWVADWVEAAEDEAAIAAARTMRIAVKCEVWHRDRLVGTIENPPLATDESEPPTD
ncbi:MAG: hypothetical protein H0V46_08165 [Sphingomonas sp.]|nr:hypothetical protein [Sphingomonas sp.]